MISVVRRIKNLVRVDKKAVAWSAVGLIAAGAAMGAGMGYWLNSLTHRIARDDLRTSIAVSSSEIVRFVSTRTFQRPQESLYGFGLYTYILFRGHPSDKETRNRYREALRSFLNLESLREHPTRTAAQRRRLNVTIVPVWTIRGEMALDRRNADPLLNLLMDREYRYAGAQQILSVFQEADGPGPFLLSTYQTVNDERPVRPPVYAIQSLGWVPARLVGLWADQFLTTVEKQQEWGPSSLRFLVLSLRTSIGVLAEGMPEVVAAAKQFGNIRKALAESIKVTGETEESAPGVDAQRGDGQRLKR